MRTFAKLLFPLALLTGLSACGDAPPPPAPAAAPAAAPAFNPAINLQVVGWGPQTANVGAEVPNKQPDGQMGLWIKVNSTEGLGEAQVLFGGQAAEKIVVTPDLITAAIPPAWINAAGDKTVEIKQVGSQKTFAVGTLKVLP